MPNSEAGRALTAARPGSAVPVQYRLSPDCSSDWTHCWASLGFMGYASCSFHFRSASAEKLSRFDLFAETSTGQMDRGARQLIPEDQNCPLCSIICALWYQAVVLL